MNRKVTTLSMLAAFALLGFRHDARTPASTASTTPAVTPAHAAGLTIHLDPATGAILEQPAPGASKLEVPASIAARWSTSDEGLIEQPNPSGGKGTYVNLQGRFENGMVATVDANGALNVPCAPGLNRTADAAASRK